MQSVTEKPKVLRTAAQLLADLDLKSREYPTDPAKLSEADEQALHLEWLATKSKTGESFAEFLQRRLAL
jgi:hypothetical protein